MRFMLHRNVTFHPHQKNNAKYDADAAEGEVFRIASLGLEIVKVLCSLTH